MQNNHQLAKRDDDGLDTQLASTAVGAGATMQRIQTPWVTAVMVQKPRNIKTLAQNAVVEAEMMAKDFYYSWEVKEKGDDGKIRKREICDISHDGALALMRHWSNCAYEPQLQIETDSKWTVSVSFIDYEAGITTPRLMQIAKEDPPGKWGRERWDDMVFQKGQSKAIRNAILAGLPAWLKKRCLAAARIADEKRLEPPDKLERERKQLIQDAKQLGLTGAHLRSKMHKSVSDYTAKDIVTMRAILRSIQEKDATIDQIFDLDDDGDDDQQSNRDSNGNGKPRRSEPPPQPKTDETPKPHQIFAHSMAKAKNISELENTAMKIGAAHQAGEIDDAERDALTEVYRSRKARLTAADPT